MWFRRMVRLMGWGRNPLRRKWDRIEAWLTLLLVALMLVIGPWAATHAAHAVYHDDLRTTAWEMQHRFPADAVLLDDARQDPADSALPPPADVPTIAQWTDRDGTVHTGTVFAGGGDVESAGSCRASSNSTASAGNRCCISHAVVRRSSR